MKSCIVHYQFFCMIIVRLFWLVEYWCWFSSEIFEFTSANVWLVVRWWCSTPMHRLNQRIALRLDVETIIKSFLLKFWLADLARKLWKNSCGTHCICGFTVAWRFKLPSIHRAPRCDFWPPWVKPVSSAPSRSITAADGFSAVCCQCSFWKEAAYSWLCFKKNRAWWVQSWFMFILHIDYGFILMIYI